MKRYILSLLTLVMCAVVSYAQYENIAFPTSATFICPNGTIKYNEDPDNRYEYMEINKINTTVSIYLDRIPEVVGVQPMIMVTSGTAGFTVGSVIEAVDMNANPITVTLDAKKWGIPVEEEYHALIMLTYVNEDNEIIRINQEPILFQIPCVLPVESIPSGFLYAYPDGEWNDYFCFADAYEKGEMEFVFTYSIEVEDENNIGTIAYYTADGNIMYMNISQYTLNTEIDLFGRFKVLKINIGNNYLMADDLDKIVVRLSGIKSAGGSAINVPEVVLENNYPLRAPRNKQSRIEESLKDSDVPVTIYNIQGMAVKDNVDRSAINDLPAGLYIINGKKVIVK